MLPWGKALTNFLNKFLILSSIRLNHCSMPRLKSSAWISLMMIGSKSRVFLQRSAVSKSLSLCSSKLTLLRGYLWII
jgi:hypothetical protein